MFDVVFILLAFSHNMAIALLIISGLLMIYLYRKRKILISEASIAEFMMFYRFNSKVALIALLWLIVAGIPRAILYKKYALPGLDDKLQVVPLVVCIVVVLLIISTTGFYWIRLSRYINRNTSRE